MDIITYKPSVDARESYVAEKEGSLDIGIDGECPICANNRDPVTGNPRFNAKALAAMEESRAAMRGEIPVKWHKTN